MSAIQELLPYIEKYPDRIRKAKEEKGMTLRELSDVSGVPYSAVSTLSAGTQANPSLYNSAALCQVLDLSLDELFGLSAPPPDQSQKLHEMELTLARQTGELQAAKMEAQMHRSGYNRLLLLSALLIPVVIGYTIWDILNQAVGVFRGEATVLAILVAMIAVAAVAILIGTIMHIVWMLRKRPAVAAQQQNNAPSKPDAPEQSE